LSATDFPIVVGLIAVALDSISSMDCTTPRTRSQPSSRRGSCAQLCRHLGGGLQFRRLSVLWPARRQDHRHRDRRSRCRRCASDLRCTDGRHYLEHRDLVAGHSVEQLGGLVGSGIAKVGLSAIVWAGLGKTAAAIVLSPLIGFSLVKSGKCWKFWFGSPRSRALP
jgi:hypothetical protein